MASDFTSRLPASVPADAASFAKFVDVAGDFAVNFSLAGLILAATWFAATWASRLVERGLGRLKVSRRDKTLQQFGSAVTRWVVAVIGLIAVLQRLGVQTTSIIAVLGAASLAIGLALQGALSNVAAGVLLLVLRPYRVGDQIELGSNVGVVRRLDLFTTDIATFDNRKIVIPNAKVLSDQVINRSAYQTRRIDLDFGVGYGSDLDQVFKILLETAGADPRVQAEPTAPWIGLQELRDSDMRVQLQVWVKTADFGQAAADLRKAGKEALDHAGVEIPFPHQVAVPYEPRHGGSALKPTAKPAPRQGRAVAEDRSAGRA